MKNLSIHSDFVNLSLKNISISRKGAYLYKNMIELIGKNSMKHDCLKKMSSAVT